MKCPRCQSPISSLPDPAGFIVCPGCGARLRRAAPGGSASSTPAPFPPRAKAAEAPHPSATLPPGARAPVPRPGTTPLTAPAPAAGAASAGGSATPGGSPGMGELLLELQAVRRVQEEILDHLRRNGRPAAERGGDEPAAREDEGRPGGAEGRPAAPLRTRRRKSALVIDDDVKAREGVLAAFAAAEVPARAVEDGRAALAAIAEEKPDVIVLELGLGGSLAGKDVVNMIKATMEWVDIPILFHTRLPLKSQKEARTLHGGDDYVRKGPGAPEEVVARTIAFFRKA